MSIGIKDKTEGGPEELPFSVLLISISSFIFLKYLVELLCGPESDKIPHGSVSNYSLNYESKSKTQCYVMTSFFRPF